MDTLVEWSRVLSPVIVLLQGLLCWILWSLRKQFVTREDCTSKCQLLEKRQAVLQTAQESSPTGKDVGDIKDRLGCIEGDIKTLVATGKGQAELLRRLEGPLNLLMEHHLREK